VAGVDEVDAAVGQPDAKELTGHELVRPCVRHQRGIGGIRLLGRRGGGASGVAKASDDQR
jgi:hypothetical protein